MNAPITDVFRFMLTRPPVKDIGPRPMDLSTESAFQQSLGRALLKPVAARQAAARLVAAQFVTGATYVSDAHPLQLAHAIEAALRELGSSDDNNHCRAALEAVFDGAASAVVQRASFRADWVRLADSIIAAKWGGVTSGSAHLLRQARVLHALRIAAGPGPIEDGELAAALARSVGVAPHFWSGSAPVAEKSETGAPNPPTMTQRGKPAIEARQIPAAVAEVLQLDRAGFIVIPKAAAPPRAAGAKAKPGRSTARGRAEPAAPAGVRLSAAGAARLSAATRGVLAHFGLDPALLSVSALANQLHALGLEAGQGEAGSLSAAKLAVEPGGATTFDPTTLPPPIRPAGWGELLTVRQKLIRYETGEVGHIENVLKGEAKVREHRTFEREEETTTEETETTTTEEREHSATERFELERETSQVISADASAKAGATVSGKYGPNVNFSASGEVTANVAKSETARIATDYAKDVTDRALKRVTERVRREHTRKIIRETEEKNVHTLNNVPGSGHISGVYQWVNKVYETTIHSYGVRMLFDLTVPEPAAFYLYAKSNAGPGTRLPEAPPEFLQAVSDVDEGNYAALAAKWGATGIKPPPSPYLTVAKTFQNVADPEVDLKLFASTAELEIPEGYEAFRATSNSGGYVSSTGGWSVLLGTALGFGPTALGNVRGKLPIGVFNYRVEAFIWTATIECGRTAEALEQWRLNTFQSLQAAYEQRRREYESKLANHLAEQRNLTVQGLNPLANRKIEREELKKWAIELITEQRFQMFNAMTGGIASGTAPEFGMAQARAEGAYVRFFENAFEWEQMTYLFYPYFWSRKREWVPRYLNDDTDPQFAEFLRAGSARVSLPVRPGFEEAVMHYLETREIWNGEDQPPDVTSPLYVSLLTEFRERTGQLGDEKPYGDPWEVRVPTSLVKLRPDDLLPLSQLDPKGQWAPPL